MRRAEIWKSIEGASDYEISSHGYVRWTDGRIKKPTISRAGVLVVNLYGNGSTKVRAVHSLVADAFLGPRPAGHMVSFKDSDSMNVDAENLTYVPLSLRQPRRPSERGKYLVGKLTRYQADEIRKRALAGESTLSLAEQFGVSSALVSNIKHGRKWT